MSLSAGRPVPRPLWSVISRTIPPPIDQEDIPAGVDSDGIPEGLGSRFIVTFLLPK